MEENHKAAVEAELKAYEDNLAMFNKQFDEVMKQLNTLQGN